MSGSVKRVAIYADEDFWRDKDAQLYETDVKTLGKRWGVSDWVVRKRRHYLKRKEIASIESKCCLTNWKRSGELRRHIKELKSKRLTQDRGSWVTLAEDGPLAPAGAGTGAYL